MRREKHCANIEAMEKCSIIKVYELEKRVKGKHKEMKN